MKCQEDGWYCRCEEHQAYWTNWAKEAIGPVKAFLEDSPLQAEKGS